MIMDLDPQWKNPIAFEVPCGPPGSYIFDPVAVDDVGILVAGGPLALALFSIGDRPRLSFTIKARAWITGFSVRAGSVYVQDGPVLSAWHIVEKRCYAAVNLITETRWLPADDDPQTEPPADVYNLPRAPAALQDALLTSRHQRAAASLLQSSVDAPPANLVLDKAESAAAAIVFTAPAVRSRQFAGGSNRIFTLGMDGLMIALTSDLEITEKFKHSVEPALWPSQPELPLPLAMAELPQPGGKVLCYLYYAGRDGGIVATDGTGSLTVLTGWQAKRSRANHLPLQSYDGLLFGGGPLAIDFFVMEVDPAAPPRVTVPASRSSWQAYDVSLTDKLALVSNLGESRLVSYDAAAKQPNRWGGIVGTGIPLKPYVIFWPGTGKDRPDNPPKLVLFVGRVPLDGRVSPGFAIALANTVDSVDPNFTSNYPPPVSMLVSGELKGTGVKLPRIERMRTRPMIMQNALYCVVSGNPSRADTTPEMLISYNLAAIREEVTPQAQAALEELRLAAQPIRLKVIEYRNGTGPGTYIPYRNMTVTAQVTGGERFKVDLDGEGIGKIDSSLARPRTFIQIVEPLKSTQTISLVRGEINTLIVMKLA
jgi:hypothetical protein